MVTSILEHGEMPQRVASFTGFTTASRPGGEPREKILGVGYLVLNLGFDLNNGNVFILKCTTDIVKTFVRFAEANLTREVLVFRGCFSNLQAGSMPAF